MRKYLLGSLFILLFFCFFFAPKSYADKAFRKDYGVDYFLQEKNSQIVTKVAFNLKLTNLTGEVAIKSFGLAFPSTFTIHDISITSNGQSVKPEINQGESQIVIKFDIPDPAIGKDTVNDIAINFYQDNLFKVNGNVWEVILPTLDEQDRSSYQVAVHLPEGTDKKISVAKPKPDSVDGKTISWSNPMSKTIYAVFGTTQLYQTKLLYHLENPKFTPVYTDIALVPDTAYQKTYLDSLDPPPSKVYLDDDGNYMARYIMKPREHIDVVYKGTVELTVKPRDEIRPYIKSQFTKQKTLLKATPGFWSSTYSKSFDSLVDIYHFVVSTLSYNYKRVSNNVNRLGAQAALKNPKDAVCTEFTDSFVSLARQNGFYAREMEGYGFSNDPQLRPLSTNSDILHAWPEYYDLNQELWVPVDPTWENTSGIDYFNSFDLNHIVFAIHSKRPDYPYPAGTYKDQDSKDVDIKAVSSTPTEKTKYEVVNFTGIKYIFPDKKYSGILQVKNLGNTYGWNIPLEATSKTLTITQSVTTIPVIAPSEVKNISITYSGSSRLVNQNTIEVRTVGHRIATYNIQAIPQILTLGMTFLPVVLVLLLAAILLYFLRKRYNRK